MRDRLATLFAMLLPLAFAGTMASCDPRDFDRLELRAPVRALRQPEDMDSSRYPTFVLPVSEPRGNAELLVTGTDNVALADFTFGADGKLGTQTVSSSRFVLGGSTIGPLAAAAPLPSSPGGAPRFVAVTERERQPLVVSLDSAAEDFAVVALGDPLPVEIGAIASGDSHGTGVVDAVIVSGTQLLIYAGGSAGSVESCDLATTVGALAVGDGWVAAGQGEGSGSAWVVTPPYAADGGPCTGATALSGHSNAVGFGSALAVGDLDGDGVREIAVSAPRERAVYFYTPSGTQARPTKIFDGATTSCGSSLTVAVLEGRRTLVAGDPGDTADPAAPGAVRFYDLEAGQDLEPLERPNADVRRFGSQVGVVSFAGKDGPVDLLWVTAEAVDERDPGVVYVYFWTRDAARDPRAF